MAKVGKNDKNNRHPQYLENEFGWRMVNDCVVGASAVKRSNELYLPMPTSMATMKIKPSSVGSGGGNVSQGPIWQSLMERSPNYHSNPAYAAYKTRAQFPDITANTLRGLLGLACKSDVDVQIELPAQMEYLLESATTTGLNLFQLYKVALAEVMKTGRFTLLVDINQTTGLPIIVPYVAQTFINWCEAPVGGVKTVVQMMFEESQATNPADYSQSDEPPVLNREFFLNQDQQYSIAFYVDGELKPDFPVQPTYLGRTLNEIPQVIIGSTDYGADVDVIPLYGLADTAVSIYQMDADLSQSEFLTANPTLVITGIDVDETPGVVGPNIAMVISNPNAKVFYTTTDTGGLGSIRSHIELAFRQAAHEGANLLGPDKAGAESGEAIKLRQAASGATLEGVIDQVGDGIEKALKIIAEWMGVSGDVVFAPVKDFGGNTLTAPEQQALLQSWIAGGISRETYLENMQATGIVNSDVTIEEEVARIEAAAPGFAVPPIVTGEPDAD